MFQLKSRFSIIFAFKANSRPTLLTKPRFLNAVWYPDVDGSGTSNSRLEVSLS